MKAAKAWCLTGLFLFSGLCSVSCGKDEGTDGGKGGSGSILTGGSGGSTAGTRSDGGQPVGAGGDGTSPGSSKLGRGCKTDSECSDSLFPELKCVTAKDAVLGNGAPPKGLCTMPCDMPTMDSPEDTCAALGTGALCYPYSADNKSGYCVEGCTFGAPDIGETKCHSRTEFACNPALLAPTNTKCSDSSDCQQGEICSTNDVCAVVIPACLPACSGDIDCEKGMYCDQSFLSGVCVPKKQTGKALGEPCTVAPDGQEEPDECLGFCSPDDQGSKTGHCAATCNFGSPCAWNSATEKYDGFCILASTQIVGSNPDRGDFGYCDLTCNCASECMDSGLSCEMIQSALPEQFRGGGFCLQPDAMSMPYDQCGAGGGGGGGAAGATGSAGAPTESAAGNGSGGVPG